MAILIDTSFLVAVASIRDVNHLIARQTMRNLKSGAIIPAPVLPEMFYMLTTRVGYTTAVKMFRLVRSTTFQISPLSDADMNRMEAIMLQYADNQFDYVDTAIMALSESLKIEDIYTFDRRDFTTFRPLHRPYLRLLP
ncbi:MAG: PIN domain-containing protein [Anaerolineae bacterium]|nr:PIN domain-containing protein [Anaerolineae bacterium]